MKRTRLLFFGAIALAVSFLIFGQDLFSSLTSPRPPVRSSANAAVEKPGASDRTDVRKSGKSVVSPEVDEPPVSATGDSQNATDVLMDSVAVADLCDDPVLQKAVDTGALIHRYIADPNHSRRVAQTTQQSIGKLCRGDHSIGSLPEGAERDPFTYLAAHSTSFQETLAYVEIQKEGELTDEARNELDLFVLRKIREARGLHELLETLTTLGQTRSVASALGVYGYPSNLDDDSAGYAAIIASCEIFGGCNAESPFAIRLCFLVCEQPMSASEFALNSVPAMRQRDLERAAAAIVAARRGQ